MKIVVLDGYALNPGDLDWSALRELGELTVFDRSAPEEVEARARGAAAILTHRVPLNRETIRHLPELRYIGILGSDTAHVNSDAARKRGIAVTLTDGVDTAFAAQHTLALLLELTQGCGHHAHAVRQGRWARCPDVTFRLQPLMELQGRTLGLIGCGRIGRAVARIATALGMHVMAADPAPAEPWPESVQRVELDQLLAESDVVSLHCPHTLQTEKLINQATLARMRPGAYLLNTAHGQLIDEGALAEALCARRLAGAGLDVLSTEPPSLKNPLLRAPRCLITPHLGWGARAVRERILAQAAAHLRAFQRQTTAPHAAPS